MSMYRGIEVARAKKNKDIKTLYDFLIWLFLQEADVIEIDGERYITEHQVYELLNRFLTDMNSEVEE